MTRRSFFRALGLGTAAIIAAPILKFAPGPIRIPVRRYMARIRLTREALEDYYPDAFVRASDEQFHTVALDMLRREEAAILNHERR